MNKSLKALKLGYVFFKVNDKWFFRYNAANVYVNDLLKEDQKDVGFIGLHIFKGWRSFYSKAYLKKYKEGEK